MNSRKLMIGTAVLVALAAMVWLAALTEGWTQAFPLKEQKNDYDNLLVDGFQEGHLYLKAEVDPGLLNPDPEVRKRSPYLLDASLYHGHYYLYFGVVPAVLAFWPVPHEPHVGLRRSQLDCDSGGAAKRIHGGLGKSFGPRRDCRLYQIRGGRDESLGQA